MSRKTATIASALAAAGLMLASAPTEAQMFATNHLAGMPGNSDALIMFDPANPAGYVTVGSLNVPNIGFGGLDFDADGNLWAYASFYKSTGGAAAGLYSINIQTGQATAIGSNFQSLQDLAYNPVDGKMYGINTQGAANTRLYEVNLNTGATTLVTTFTGLPTQHYIQGFGFDSNGNMYLQDIANNNILTGQSGNFSVLYSLDFVGAGSQGLTIDWSRDNTGYHGSVSQGDYPNYVSTINIFDIHGGGYTIGLPFGPNSPDGLPPVQPGDIAIMPIPAPGSILAFAAAGMLATRRRR